MSTDQRVRYDEWRDWLLTVRPGRDGTDSIAEHKAHQILDALAEAGLEPPQPPEPEWKPGQVVQLRTPSGSRRLAQRNPANDGWITMGDGLVWPNKSVVDVEPVAVLTAEDVRGLASAAGQRALDRGIHAANITEGAVLAEFAERGLSV